jgi:hypothetical protein
VVSTHGDLRRRLRKNSAREALTEGDLIRPPSLPSALEGTVAGARLVDPPRGALRNEGDDVDDCIEGALVAHDVDVAAVVDRS